MVTALAIFGIFFLAVIVVAIVAAIAFSSPDDTDPLG